MKKYEVVERVVLPKEEYEYYQQLRRDLKLHGTEQTFRFKKKNNIAFKKRY